MIITFKEKFFFIPALVGLVLAGFLFMSGGDNTHHLWDEGHLTEIVTEFGYLAAFFLFLNLALSEKGHFMKLWLYFWAFCSLLFFGEETSWLQHYIAYETPEGLSGINTQEEFNLHNLDFLQSSSIHGGEGFSIRNLLTAQHLFQMGFFAYFFALPLACKLRPFKNWAEKLEIPLPGLNVLLFIWVPVFTTIALSVLSLSDPATKSAMAEAREMFYGLGVGMFGISALITLRLNKAADK